MRTPNTPNTSEHADYKSFVVLTILFSCMHHPAHHPRLCLRRRFPVSRPGGMPTFPGKRSVFAQPNTPNTSEHADCKVFVVLSIYPPECITGSTPAPVPSLALPAKPAGVCTLTLFSGKCFIFLRGTVRMLVTCRAGQESALRCRPLPDTNASDRD